MKKLVLFAAFAAMAGASALTAQTPDRPEGRGRGMGREMGGPGRGGMMMDQMLLQGITLTDAQKAQLEKLHTDERAKMEAQRGQAQGRPDFAAIREARQKGDTATANRLMQEQRAKMEAQREAQFSAIRAILTADQQKQFDANVAQMKEHMGRGGRGGSGTRGSHNK